MDWKKYLPLLLVLPVALMVGVAVAQGEWLWPGLALAVGVGAIVIRLAPGNVSLLILATLFFGYIAGNRGFAQLSLSGSLPLFPAEIGLAVTLTIMLWQCARGRVLPFRKNGIDFMLVGWLLLSSIRLVWDVRNHGMDAIRDFAMVYYALFFFIARHVTQDEATSAWFSRVLRGASLTLLPLFLLFEQFPELFLNTLTVRGNPLIFFKADLAGTGMSIGAIAWFFHYKDDRRRIWALGVSLMLIGVMLSTDNRASMLALVVPAVILGCAGRTQLMKSLGFFAIAAVLVLMLWAQFGSRPWRESPLYGFYERSVSIIDFGGQRTYLSESAGPKGGNNQFRAVWWKTVIDETNEANPWLGIGFGHDLADRFLKAYYPDSNETFTARSPHNFFITVYARTGLIGLATFLSIAGLIAVRSWRAIRSDRSNDEVLPWCVVVSLLTSATFGVVLEGPMGAVLFWISLGLAEGRLRASEASHVSPSPGDGVAPPEAVQNLGPLSARRE
jgi:O-antigen ligase